MALGEKTKVRRQNVPVMKAENRGQRTGGKAGECVVPAAWGRRCFPRGSGEQFQKLALKEQARCKKKCPSELLQP